MGQEHTRLISANQDASIKRLGVGVNRGDGSGEGYLMSVLKPSITFKRIQLGDGSTDDIQDLSAAIAATTGFFTVQIDDKTINLNTSTSAAGLKSSINSILPTGRKVDTVTGGPFGTAPFRFTTTHKAQPRFLIIKDTTESKPYKWTPATDKTEFYDIISNSLYSLIGLYNVQGVYLTKTPTQGNVTLTCGSGGTMAQVPFNCTSGQFKTAMSQLNFNVANYDVYGGPWPKPIVIQFKNSLRYMDANRFAVTINGLDQGAIPTIIPLGKQILVSYNRDLGKYIVVRPGYI